MIVFFRVGIRFDNHDKYIMKKKKTQNKIIIHINKEKAK